MTCPPAAETIERMLREGGKLLALEAARPFRSITILTPPLENDHAPLLEGDKEVSRLCPVQELPGDGGKTGIEIVEHRPDLALGGAEQINVPELEEARPPAAHVGGQRAHVLT